MIKTYGMKCVGMTYLFYKHFNNNMNWDLSQKNKNIHVTKTAIFKILKTCIAKHNLNNLNYWNLI